MLQVHLKSLISFQCNKCTRRINRKTVKSHDAKDCSQLCPHLDLAHRLPTSSNTTSSDARGSSRLDLQRSANSVCSEQEPEECCASLELAASLSWIIRSVGEVVGGSITLIRMLECVLSLEAIQLTELLQLCTPSFAASTTPAMNVRRVATASNAIMTTGIASAPTKAAAAPRRRTIQEKTATKMA